MGIELNVKVVTSTVGELREVLAQAERAGLHDDATVLAKIAFGKPSDGGAARLKQLLIRPTPGKSF